MPLDKISHCIGSNLPHNGHSMAMPAKFQSDCCIINGPETLVSM